MSDHYFASARAAGCIGLKDGMGGFHECAMNHGCSKYAVKLKKKPKKPKKKKGPNHIILADDDEDVIGEGKKKVKGGCGTCTPWITHVKAYQSKHGCSYKEALSQASKTYHK